MKYNNGKSGPNFHTVPRRAPVSDIIQIYCSIGFEAEALCDSVLLYSCQLSNLSTVFKFTSADHIQKLSCLVTWIIISRICSKCFWKHLFKTCHYNKLIFTVKEWKNLNIIKILVLLFHRLILPKFKNFDERISFIWFFPPSRT